MLEGRCVRKHLVLLQIPAKNNKKINIFYARQGSIHESAEIYFFDDAFVSPSWH